MTKIFYDDLILSLIVIREVVITMDEFGIRFGSGTEENFNTLRSLFLEIKNDKDNETERDESDWINFVPDSLKNNFDWPDELKRAEWLDFIKDKAIAIPDVSSQLSAKWDFYSIIDAFHSGEYDLMDCVKVNDSYEMHIYPFSYPYGGIGPLIALAEGFCFEIIGINEYGKYLKRDEIGRA